jgi:hypothetical protein
MKEPARINRNRRTAILALLTILAVAAPNSLGSSLQLYDVSMSNANGFPGLETWNSSILDVLGTPGIAYNSTASDITSGTVFIPAHSVAFSPGPDGENGVVRWTAPTAGTYDLTSAFRGDDFVYPTTTDVHVLLDGVSLFTGGVYVFGPAASFSDIVSVKAGDTIDFTVDIGSDGSFIGDSTGISATLTAHDGTVYDLAADFSVASNPNGVWSYGYFPVLNAVPEPSSWTLLGLGFLTLFSGIRGWGRWHR